MKLSLLSIIYFQKPLIEEKVLLSAAIPLLQYLLRAKLICNKVGCDFKKQTKEYKILWHTGYDSTRWLYLSTHQVMVKRIDGDRENVPLLSFSSSYGWTNNKIINLTWDWINGIKNNICAWEIHNMMLRS